MANNLYLDFKIHYGLTGFSQNCICLASVSPFKVAYPRYCIYKQVKYSIQLCKYNISTSTSIFELELYIGVDSGNSKQSDLEKICD